jgi:transcriptional regulator with XRE-family HTH domain
LLAKVDGTADISAMKSIGFKRKPTRTGAQGANEPNGAHTGGLKAAAFANVGMKAESSVRAFCESFGVTQDSVTRLTGFSPRAVAHWASGRMPSASAQKRITELKRLFDALSDLVDAKAIGPWLKRANSAFDGSTPLQVIERGETDRLWRMIWELQSGNTG